MVGNRMTDHRAIGNEATELPPGLRRAVGYHLRGASAMVCERFDGTITLLHHGKYNADPPEARSFLDGDANPKRERSASITVGHKNHGLMITGRG